MFKKSFIFFLFGILLLPLVNASFNAGDYKYTVNVTACSGQGVNILQGLQTVQMNTSLKFSESKIDNCEFITWTDTNGNVVPFFMINYTCNIPTKNTTWNIEYDIPTGCINFTGHYGNTTNVDNFQNPRLALNNSVLFYVPLSDTAGGYFQEYSGNADNVSFSRGNITSINGRYGYGVNSSVDSGMVMQTNGFKPSLDAQTYTLIGTFTYLGPVAPGSYSQLFFVSQQGAGNNGGQQSGSEGAQLHQLVNNGGWNTLVSTSSPLTYGKMFIYASRFASNNQSILINGTQEATQTVSGSLNYPAFVWNFNLNTQGGFVPTMYQGEMSDIIYFNRSLSNQEIAYFNTQTSTLGPEVVNTNSVIPDLTIISPSNTNFTSLNVPINFTGSGNFSLFNATINSSCNNNSYIVNQANNSFVTGNLTCFNAGVNWFSVNLTSSTSSVQANFTNVSFYIYFGANFSLLFGSNLTALNNFNLNVSNSTYTQNYSNINSGYSIEYPNLPSGNNLSFNFIPLQSIYIYPDDTDLKGSFTNSNTSFNNVHGFAYPIQNFLVYNSSTPLQTWNLNYTYANGTQGTCSATNYNCTFSSKTFGNQNVFFNALVFGYGNQSINIPYNSSSPYLNYSFTVQPSGLNFTVYQEYNLSIILNGTYTIFNATQSYQGTFTNSSNFLNNSQIPSGVVTACFQSPGYFQRCYVVTLSSFSTPILTAYLPSTSQSIVTVTFTVKNTIGQTLPGTTVLIQLLQGGNYITVGSLLTDSTGTAIFSMNANSFYSVTATNGALTGTLPAFLPAGQTYTIILGGNNTFNYSYIFQNVSFFFNPTSFSITSNPILMQCGFLSNGGSLNFMQFNISSYNSTSHNYTLLLTNSSTNPNGIIFSSNVNTSGINQLKLDCCFINLNQNPYCISYNYTTFQPAFKSNVSSIFGDLGALTSSWLFQLIIIIICIGVSVAVGDANELYGVAAFTFSLGLFAFIGFLNPLVTALVYLVCLIAYFQLMRNTHG